MSKDAILEIVLVRGRVEGERERERERAGATDHLWGSENDLWVSILPIYIMDPRD